VVNDGWRINSFLTGVLAPLPLRPAPAPSFCWCASTCGRAGVAAGVPAFTVVVKLLARELAAGREHSREDAVVRHGRAEHGDLAVDQGLPRKEGVRTLLRAGQQGELEIRQQRIESLLTPSRWPAGAAVLGLLWFGSRGVASGTIRRPRWSACCFTGRCRRAREPAGRGLWLVSRRGGGATPDRRDVRGWNRIPEGESLRP
jgi:hypothetical protein